MAGRLAKEINLAHKGKTGPTTVNRRKKKGMKARPNVAKTGKGKPR